MSSVFMTLFFVVCIAILLWMIVERFAPDPLLANILKLGIFAGVVYWLYQHIWPLIR